MASVGKKAEAPKNEAQKVEPTKTAEVPSEKKDEKANGEAKAKVDEAKEEELKKAEELLEQKLKEIQKNKPRFGPHFIPNFEAEKLREGYMWNLRIFPIEQDDLKNPILDTATKTAHKALYYVPKRKTGQGIAELYVASNNDAHAVMGRILRTAFYHRYVTVEVTRRAREGRNPNAPYRKIEETATLVLDTSRIEKIKNTVVSKEDPKSLGVRYLSEKTSAEFLRVLFPFSQSTKIQTHDNVQIGLVEANSKPDLQLFMKAYVTVIINEVSVLSLQNKDPMEKENEIKADIEKVVPPIGEWKQVPTEVADKQYQRRDDKNETARIMKRTVNQQQMGEQPPNKRGRIEQPAQRGVGGAVWGSSATGSQFSSGVDFRGNRVAFGAPMNQRTVTAEMMMMQARLNQTIRSQLMMLNTSARRGGFNTGGFTGRFSGAAGLRGARGQKGFGGGW